LAWREESSDRLVVGATIGEVFAEVELGLDGEGRIAETFSADRPRAVKDAFVATPWRGSFSDYRRHDGWWLP
jgi:hypothetical protein